MKLDNMFKKTRRPSGKKGHIGGKHQSPEVPEGLLCKCNKCQKAIITEDVITGGYICPKCHGYFRMPAPERIRSIADEDTFEEWDRGIENTNPIGYKGYPEFQNALEELVRNKLNSIQRMEVTYGRITQSEILETVLQSDIEKIKMTLSAIDHKAFNWAIDTLLEAKRIYVVGIRSCAPLASFMGFYLNLVCDNVITVNTNSSSEIFEQIIRIGEGDVIIGISFPRYSMRTLKALEFASNRKAKVITLTDSIHSPMNQYSSCNLIARSDMASIVDSLVAPLSVINALIVAICMKKQKEVVSTLETLEKIWGEYQVYSGEESSQEGGSAGTNESYRQNKGEE